MVVMVGDSLDRHSPRWLNGNKRVQMTLERDLMLEGYVWLL